MKFGSVCSGIEAASVAWRQLGWRAAWLSEIEPFPSAVLAHHYPDVPNHGDMTRLPERIRSGEVEAPDVFCGGTPCQAFSVAGMRKSLADARGNLSLTFCEIADELDAARLAGGKPPAIIFWENVPGVLNTADNAFGCFLAGLAGEDEPLQPAGGKWTNAGAVFGPSRTVAWRILDAQYFGVAQRRRRVFVVASARNDFDPAAVLFEFDGVRRDTAPSREAGEAAAGSAGAGAAFGGMSPVAGTLTANTGGMTRPAGNANELDFCVPINMAHGQGGAEIGFDRGPTLTCNHEALIAAYPVTQFGDTAGTLTARHDSSPCADRGMNVVAFHPTQDPIRPDATPKWNDDLAFTLTQPSPTGGGHPQAVMTAMQVRRLTPVECERLQGFPDNYTAIPWRKKPASECPDGPRHKALGNSWAVPVVRWIGQRIAAQLQQQAANDNNPNTNTAAA